MRFEVGDLESLPDSKGVRFDIGEHRVAVFKIGEEVYAIGDRCSHAEASLSEGEVFDCVVECPRHGSEFDLRSGQAGRPAPAIVMVTARVEEIDRLLGLELGADDYICKPFSPREVVARVKAVLRRGTHAAADAPGGLQLDEAAWRATLDGRDLGLTVVEFQLLKVLSARPGRIFSREQLMDAMYRDERIVSDRTVDSHIKKLRRKMDEAAPGRELIHSVYGLGYKFELPPQPLTS